MSSNRVPFREISDTVDHKSTHVTETPVRLAIRGGATVVDDVVGDEMKKAPNPIAFALDLALYRRA